MQAILFDLDGTLLPVDTMKFVSKYFKAVAAWFTHLFPPDQFQRLLWKAVSVMIETSHPKETNAEAFVRAFQDVTRLAPEKFMPTFEQFYREGFPKLKDGITPNPQAARVVDLSRALGYKVVLATNPVYPENAILQRIEWAGLKPEQFDLITTYENMHACKPSLDYFTELVGLIRCKPNECLMVGNDTLEDIVAREVGINTFLAEEFLIDSPKGHTPHWRGSLADLEGLLLKFHGD
ncbi:MAG TPA: HAD family hydrolase [Firmicutes bacterium]|nr:HAD family hydrolase [Bacillota bacterium]